MKFFGDLFGDLMLYARQIAWWNATPKRRDKLGKTEKEIVLPIRAQQAQDKGDVPYYPPIPSEVSYLLSHLEGLGFSEVGMAGPVPLSWQEIAAWSHLQGVELNPWEATVLRSMSEQFVRELAEAENHLRPPPWSPEPEQIDQQELAQRIKDVLRG